MNKKITIFLVFIAFIGIMSLEIKYGCEPKDPKCEQNPHPYQYKFKQ